ncbi:MAG: amidohydrolase family protein [Patescibacteria group bacterium]|nr:amidohydrolase family protein [Patescibacteria group bacterium]
MTKLRWPPLIDVHVHLREPGAIEKEDFTTGSEAAVAGGFGMILDMPNNPIPTVSYKRLLDKIKLAEKKSKCMIGFHFGTNGKNLKEFKKASKHKWLDTV